MFQGKRTLQFIDKVARDLTDILHYIHKLLNIDKMTK